MKKIKIYLLFILFILIPTIVDAATDLSAATQNPVVGTSVYVQLEANYGKTLNIGEFHTCVLYDTSVFSLEDIIWIKMGSDKGTTTTTDGRVCVDKTGADWTSGPIIQLKLKVNSAAFTEIKLERNGESYYTNGDVIAQTLAGIYMNTVMPSDNTLIKTLYIEGYKFSPTFSQNQYNYNLIVPPEVTQINVVGEKYDNRQTITGTGIRKLEYGDNRVRVVVTAQDQSTRTYEIMVTRTDNRTGDTTLKSLNVSNTNIKIEKDKYVYEALVSKSIDSVLINGRTTDPNATLLGTGTKKLEIGLNTFELTIQSSKGRESKYTINITRSAEELQVVKESSKLLSLNINNLVLDLSNEQKTFLFGINKDIDALDINAVTESQTAQIKVEGNENLKSGINVVKIIVTEEIGEPDPSTGERKKETTEYIIIVNKNPNNASVINDISSIKGTSNFVYSTTSNINNIIPASSIMTIKNNNKSLYYNTVNLTNGLLSQVILKNNLPDSDIDATIKLVKESPLTYNINIPKDNTVKIYIENYYQTGTKVRVYSYTTEGQYTLITDGTVIQNGYVTFTTNGELNYIITTNDLKPPVSPLTQVLSKYKKYIIGVIIAIIVVVAIIIFINKREEEKEKKEPLY